MKLRNRHFHAGMRALRRRLLIADSDFANVLLKHADVISHQRARVVPVSDKPIYNAPESKSLEAPAALEAMQHAMRYSREAAALLPGAAQSDEQRGCLGVWNTVTIIRYCYAGQSEFVMGKPHIDAGGVGVEPVPDDFGQGVNRPRLRLSLNEVGLYLNGKPLLCHRALYI